MKSGIRVTENNAGILSRRQLRRFEKRIYFNTDFHDAEELFESDSMTDKQRNFNLQKAFRSIIGLLPRIVYRSYLAIWFLLYFIASKSFELLKFNLLKQIMPR